MNYLIWPASLAGLISTAVIFGTDVFFLTVGRPALRSVAESAATEVMGFIHLFGDRRMPVWGILAMLSNFLLVLFNGSGHRGFYLFSMVLLILFVVIYERFSKPINRIQTEAAKNGRKTGQCSCVAGVLGPLTDDARSAAGRIHARPVRCIAVSSGWLFVM